ncbi:uncharacterized protein LOC122303749 [Carya illinoinensis]|uniref:Uncharacterized protein n=1 Tax=Carya illinoinensis TaxID=32201 RepID=A0A8T1R201_CARIL|nr:uncharacterized protein LOC122303749 [Carya illinoinensis]KAG6660777.1 hypothetical protein CIPAW_03G128300 [Carya illinoinensis]
MIHALQTPAHTYLSFFLIQEKKTSTPSREREIMSSLEEERLAQMVEEFIESESSSSIFSASSKCPPNHHTQYLTLQEILGSGTEAEAEVLESVSRHMGSIKDAEKTTSLKKWLVMRLKMDGCEASLCQTSWVTSLGCPAGDYEYIDIKMKAENGDSRRLIVDMDFKSQFELARPTQTYKELTDALPYIFIGTEEKLNKIISLLCSAAKQSLRERGLHIPPWRTTTYMQSKWLSDHHKTPDAEKRELAKAGAGAYGYSTNKWTPSPPMVIKPKPRRNLGGGSGLSSQFSEMSINCC